MPLDFPGIVSRFTSPVRWGPNEPLSHQKLNRMMAGVVRRIMVGPGLRKVESPDGSAVAIMVDHKPSGPGWRWGVITAAEKVTPSDAEEYRWTYTVEFVDAKTATAFAGWEAPSDPDEVTARNTFEVPNTAAATAYGNGVQKSDLYDGTDRVGELLPVPTGLPVQVFLIPAPNDAGLEYWISIANGVHVGCDPLP